MTKPTRQQIKQVCELANTTIKATQQYCAVREYLGVRAGYALQDANMRRANQAFAIAQGRTS